MKRLGNTWSRKRQIHSTAAKPHLFDSVAVASIPVAENNPVVFYRCNPVIGESYAMGVATKVTKHLLWTCKRFFGIDNPLLVPNLLQVFLKILWSLKLFYVGIYQIQVSFFELPGQKRGAEKKRVTAFLPATAIK